MARVDGERNVHVRASPKLYYFLALFSNEVELEGCTLFVDQGRDGALNDAQCTP